MGNTSDAIAKLKKKLNKKNNREPEIKPFIFEFSEELVAITMYRKGKLNQFNQREESEKIKGDAICIAQIAPPCVAFVNFPLLLKAV
ncbi:hypothetical protein B6D60_05880 [candidate division KSB1 bacterium 4484_87]|nr:MAG: hypothetical protein B6D60_05880 [candidate division KSB1 bacterium 4484_87]